MSPLPNMVLTGCASGIGRHLAGVLASRGHRLILTDIDEEALRELADAQGWKAPRVQVRRLDVSSAEDWSKVITLAVSSWGRLDVLMNIAGYIQPGFVHELNDKEVDRHMDVNAKGVMYGSRAAAAQMVAQGHGHIINVASLAGIAPVPGISLYSASKHAVRGFSLAIAQELRPRGVYVTVVCPDAVKTPMLTKQLPFEAAAMTFSNPTPLSVHDVERLILDKVLPDRPMEATLPVGRGLLARLASFIPEATMWLGPIMRSRGLSQQTRRRKLRRDGHHDA